MSDFAHGSGANVFSLTSEKQAGQLTGRQHVPKGHTAVPCPRAETPGTETEHLIIPYRMPVTPPVMPSDAQLVRQALAGSQSAYRDLVSRYAGPAVNLAARMVQDRALAEELAQEAFVRAFDHLSTYDERRRFAGWFFQILHNVAIDYLRRKRPPALSLDDLEESGHAFPDATSMGTPPDAQAEQSALARALDACLERIRPEYREAIVLHYREDLSVEEVAEAMSLPVGTVKTYLFRARKELASLLSAQGWAGTTARASGARKTGVG